MFNKILVAIDNTDTGKHVFEEALALAQATGASLMLLHVLSPYEEGHPVLPALSNLVYHPSTQTRTVEVYLKELDTYKARELERLRSHVAQAKAFGVEADFTLTIGGPGYAICDLARSWGVDLIVVGHRGRVGLNEVLLGSVSNYVTHHAPCSVLTVHAKGDTKTKGLDEERRAASS